MAKRTKEVAAEEVLDEVVETMEEEPVEKPKKQKYAVVSNCNYLNFRKQPIPGSDVEIVLPAGTKVEIIQNENKSDWAYCLIDGQLEAYALKEYLSFE